METRHVTPLLLVLSAACRSEPAPGVAASAAPPPLSASIAVTTASASAATLPKPAYEAPLDVDIADVLKEYKANELRADGLYKGKLIRAFGTVSQIGKTPIGDGAFVTIGTGTRLEIPMMQCMLRDPSDPLATALNAGGKAAIQGRVRVDRGGCGHVLGL